MYKAYLIALKSENMSMHRHQKKLTSIINKKTIRYHLNKFINEYNILPEERKPLTVVKHVLKTLFWAAVYLAFSYLTITWSFEVIQQYRDNKVTTNMKAIINNNVTYLPNMTICFKINASALFKIHSSSKYNYTSAWSRFFNETTREGIFKVNNYKIYDDEIYLSLLKYLAMIYEAERAWESGLTQISTFHSEESDDWTAVKKVLVPNIERFKITLKQLQSIFNGKFCHTEPDYSHNFYLIGVDYMYSATGECVAGNKISFIGTDTICFRLSEYPNFLRPLGTTEPILLVMHYGGKNMTWCQEFTIDLGSESRTTPRRATTRNETHGFYYYRIPNQVVIQMDISMKALYRKLPYVKGDVQCSSNTTREVCENKCLRGWISANCHCSPITFNLTDTSGYRKCTVDDYAICLKKYAENATYLCTNKCVPICEQWHYQNGLLLTTIPNQFHVEILTKTFDYVIIEQVFSWNTLEEFIGALGGVLGIWLGLDFVIIIEFIVKLVTKLVKKVFLRNIHNSEEGKHEESANSEDTKENGDNGVLSSNEIGSHVVGYQIECREDESEIAGTSIRQINETEKQKTSRKKRENNLLEDKLVQQRRKRSNKNRADSAISDEEMKNIDVHGGRLRNQKANTTDNIDAVQDESTAHSNNSSARSWSLQKILLLFLNSDTSTKKSALFLRLVIKLFWAAIYIVGSVFTTLWCIELINLYLEDEAAYFPSLITNRTVSLPPPSHCVAYCSNLSFLSHGNISDALTDYFSQSDIDRASFIQISNGKNWSEPLVSIGLLYFSIVAASETNYSDVSFISEYERQLDLSSGEDIILRNDIDISLNDILLPKLLEWKVTANELRQKLGAEVARMIELKISFTNSNGTIDIVNETSFYTAAINDEWLCYGLSYAVNFTDPDDVLEFSINRAWYPQLFPAELAYIIFSDYILEPKSEQFDINRYTVSVFDSTHFWYGYGYAKRYYISLFDRYTSQPATKGVKHCSPNTTKSYCYAQCRIDLIEKLCSCSPTYWTSMIQPTSGLNECTFNRYMECLNFNASDHLDCDDSCVPFCTATYSRNIYKPLAHPQESHDTAVVRLSVKDGIYVSIEEKAIFTFSDLLNKVQLDT